MADDDSKPFDRQRPFRRIRNDDFIVGSAPDGKGVPCGCHLPEEFGGFTEEFLKIWTMKRRHSSFFSML